MADDTASANLHHVLEHGSEMVHKATSAVLFRRGEKDSGMIVVLSGKVRLDRLIRNLK
jgi:CRP-like cAMP-binding protein